MKFFDKSGSSERLRRSLQRVVEAEAGRASGPEVIVVEFERRVTLRQLGVIWSSEQAHTVDALAVRGDEGRGSLRKAPGSRQQTLIRRCPNGETHPSGYRALNP